MECGGKRLILTQKYLDCTSVAQTPTGFKPFATIKSGFLLSAGPCRGCIVPKILGKDEGKRSATPLWIGSAAEKHQEKRRRASLAAALHILTSRSVRLH